MPLPLASLASTPMPESLETYLQINPARCRVAKRIQGLVSELYNGADIVSSLARHLCLDGLSIRPLGLDPAQPQPLITEAQLFGFGRPAPGPQAPLELRLLSYGAKPQALLHGSESELSGWLAWADAWMNRKPLVAPKTISFGYMLQGDFPTSNVDPYATAATADNEWLEDGGPHVMMLVPDLKMLEGMSTDPNNGGPYVMWRGTDFAHVMIPTPKRD